MRSKHSFVGVVRFLLTSWKVNLASAMEYRLSFFLLAGMMFINNFLWLFFWDLFFGRFPVVQGWEMNDVMLMWAVGAGGFGWANVLFGNLMRLASVIAMGQLDVYMSQPKPVLLNVLASRMSVTSAGDLLFGLVVYAWVGDHSRMGMLLFALGMLICGVLFIGVLLVFGCLAFFIGNAEGIASQAANSFISLTLYPTNIFRGIARLVLFSVVPAGFISYLPIGLLRDRDPAFAAYVIGFTILLTLSGVVLFYAGLRRYTSGNSMAMRS